jgi:alkanesulfonate monooxygenase SsuD/methylene tetrahydromethanopterin reductase-like flavin-dependent oxidoreductase (luciferase family)
LTLAARLDEGAAVLQRLLAGEAVDHDGEHYRVSDVRFPPTTVPIWTSGFWPRKGPVRGAAGADGLFPQIRDAADDFRIPTPAELITIRADFERAGGKPGADIVIWSPSPAWAPDAAKAASYEDAGVTWWLQDGSEVSPEALRERIAAGPPRP